MTLIEIGFGAPWLGHGRRLEFVLAFICLSYGCALIVAPSFALDSKATVDLYWLGFGRTIGLPFLLKGVLTGWGLLSNIKDWPYSRQFRYCGALVGSFIWTSMVWKYTIYGSPLAFGSVCAGAFLISSIGIIGMASANLPRPGAPGAGVPGEV